MRKIFAMLSLVSILGFFLFIYLKNLYSDKQNTFISKIVVRERPFEKYTIDNLSVASLESEVIDLSTKIVENKDYASYLFNFRFKPDFTNFKSLTGQVNIPNGSGPYPLIFMIRGYVDQKSYKTGDGTRNAAAYFAKNGFLTLSPDFLGFAGSDKESSNIFETRFQTYVTTLSLLKSLKSLNSWDGKNIFIWAHSNGGQIALTTLTITKENYPTVLWAPVTKPFPYSVLYYTDESDDGGKLIRRELSKFEDVYDTDLFSFTNYLDRISSPILICHGMADDAVPPEWSQKFAKELKNMGKVITYKEFPESDHNLRPMWDEAIGVSLEFFKSLLKK